MDECKVLAVGGAAAAGTDAWRLNYARCLGDAVWVTPRQVARIVDAFDWPTDRVEILTRLVPRLMAGPYDCTNVCSA